MAHPQPRHDTPELRLRCLTEFPPLDGTLPIATANGSVSTCSEGPSGIVKTLRDSKHMRSAPPSVEAVGACLPQGWQIGSQG